MHFLCNSLIFNGYYFCFFLSILGHFCLESAKWRFFAPARVTRIIYILMNERACAHEIDKIKK